MATLWPKGHKGAKERAILFNCLIINLLMLFLVVFYENALHADCKGHRYGNPIVKNDKSGIAVRSYVRIYL